MKKETLKSKNLLSPSQQIFTKTKNIQNELTYATLVIACTVSRECRIHQLHLFREVRLPPPPPSPTSVFDMTVNNHMVRFQ